MVSINDAKKEHIAHWTRLIKDNYRLIDTMNKRKKKYTDQSRIEIVDGIIESAKQSISEYKENIKEVYGQFGK